MKKIPFPICLASSLVALGLWTCGCSRIESSSTPAESNANGFPRPAKGEFSVMTFNVHQYALVSPDKSADTLEPKPREETDALIEIIRQASPDILAVQEMGDPAAWDDFKARLRSAGLQDYTSEEYLRTDPEDRNIALLSRFPIVARNPHTNDLYTIGPTQFPVRRGIIEVDIEIHPGYRLRLLVAHLKSKLFHEYGQAEMRRNEARLLCNHVRASLKENPGINLLVVGDMNDDPSSRPMKEILQYQDQPILHDLRPEDGSGSAWTYRGSDDSHLRIDYMLVSDGLAPEVVLSKTQVVEFPGLDQASDHRPLVATFVATEQEPSSAPDLSTRQPHEFQLDD